MRVFLQVARIRASYMRAICVGSLVFVFVGSESMPRYQCPCTTGTDTHCTRTWEASRGIVSAEQMRTTAPLSPSSPSHASFLLPLLFLVHVCRHKKKMVPASKALKGA